MRVRRQRRVGCRPCWVVCGDKLEQKSNCQAIAQWYRTKDESCRRCEMLPDPSAGLANPVRATVAAVDCMLAVQAATSIKHRYAVVLFARDDDECLLLKIHPICPGSFSDDRIAACRWTGGASA